MSFKKEHGRLKPADPMEYAKVEGKTMVCPKCGQKQIVAYVIFGETRCKSCDTLLIEQDLGQAKLNNHIQGKIND